MPPRWRRRDGGIFTMTDWIVVVDDDVANLKLAGHILSKSRMRVSALRSGQALLNYIVDNKPDLILLDILMPEMDGFETLKRLRELEKGKEQIPVIFLTANEDEGSELRGLQLGAIKIKKKPFVPDSYGCKRLSGLNETGRWISKKAPNG